MRFRNLLAVILMLGMLCPQVSAEVFPLDQVRPGMRGVGRTVVQGTQIEEFQMEIITVIPQAPPTPPLVMIKVSGDVIDRSGGIASGMSGSPVYIDNKLLGAIGYGYAFTDHRVGLVTPADWMLNLLKDLPTEKSGIQPNLPDGAEALKTPLMIGGMYDRAFTYLRSELARLGLQVMSNVTGQVTRMEGSPLQPGSAFGVQLLRGDFQAVAFGTVTYVKDDAFTGFGHPFLHRGDVNYFVTPAIIHYTMPSMEFPFKIASAGDTIGTLYQDRAAGVAGVLGHTPSYLPINIQVEDRTRNTVATYQVETVMDEKLILPLVVSSVYQAIDATLDRIGNGTAFVQSEFLAANLPTAIVRDNMFYSDSDIAVWALYDLIEALELLMFNKLQKVELTEVSTKIIIEEKRKTASIEKAIPRDFQVAAKDSVEVEVAIRPYRGEVEYRILRIDIPEDTLPGLMTITVRGGGSGYYSVKPTVHTTWQSMDQDSEDYIRHIPSGGESLDKLLDRFMQRERNNEIVAEFYPFINSFSSADDTENSYSETSYNESESLTPLMESEIDDGESDRYQYRWDDRNNEPIRVRLTTQYVIEGVATFDVEVIAP